VAQQRRPRRDRSLETDAVDHRARPARPAGLLLCSGETHVVKRADFPRLRGRRARRPQVLHAPSSSRPLLAIRPDAASTRAAAAPTAVALLVADNPSRPQTTARGRPTTGPEPLADRAVGRDQQAPGAVAPVAEQARVWLPAVLPVWTKAMSDAVAGREGRRERWFRSNPAAGSAHRTLLLHGLKRLLISQI
jgi:hypothetical protein